MPVTTTADAQSKNPEKPRTSGIALVLVAGLLSLLLLLSATFVYSARLLALRAGVSHAARLSALAADSGLEYASARLAADTGRQARPPTAANRADDWKARGSDPWANPSYSRGEPWVDDPVGTPGAYDAGLDGFLADADLDGDGRFSAWSGRLRFMQDASCWAALRFSLRTAPSSGLICVNSGEIGSPLADHNADGILNADDPAYSAEVPSAAYRDPTYPGNWHLVNLLDNLGAVLDLSIEMTRPYWQPTPLLGMFETSPLGTLLVSNRPRGGYRSVDEIRPLLSAADFTRVAPFLTTEGNLIPLPVFSHANTHVAYQSLYETTTVQKPLRIEWIARIDLAAAPKEVIAAALRHLAASGTFRQVDLFGNQHAPINTPFIRLGAGEADAVAAELEKRGPIQDWTAFLALLRDACAAHWRNDDFTTDLDESIDPGRVRLKQDLILANAIGAGGYFGDPFLWRASSLEVPRLSGKPAIRKIFRDLLTGPLNTLPYDHAGIPRSLFQNPPPPAMQYPNGLPPRHTVPFRLGQAVPRSWEVACRAKHASTQRSGTFSAERSGTLQVGESALLTGQRQFEMPLASPANPWRFPGGGLVAESPAQKEQVQTYPLFSRTSYDATTIPGYPGSNDWMAISDLYPATWGSVRLAFRQVPKPELAQARFATPFNEDRLDPQTGDPEPGTWYNPADWADNLGDPLTGGGPGGKRSPPPAGSAGNPVSGDFLQLFHAGARFGPGGFRLNRTPGDLVAAPFPAGKIQFNWKDDWFDHLPFEVDGNGLPDNATLSWWHPSQLLDPLFDSNSSALAGGTILIFPRKMISGAMGENPCFYVKWDLQGGLSTSLEEIPPWWQGDPSLSKAGWHHLAVTLSGGRGQLFVDGIPQGDRFPLSLISPQAGWTLLFSPPIRDIRIHSPSLSPEQIREEAARPIYEPWGRYTSPSLRFSDRFGPKGARVRGLAWDAFIPEQAGGRIMFDLLCYGEDGTLLNPGGSDPGRNLPFRWGAGDPTAIPFLVAGTRRAKIRITFVPNPAPLPLGPNGADVFVLRDAPHLEEVTLFFGPDRPRWATLR